MVNTMSPLIGYALLVIYTFFGVVPMMLNALSQFTVLKQFSEEMVREGVIEEAKVRELLPKKQIAGVIVTALMLFVLLSVCIKGDAATWACAGIPLVLGCFKYRNIVEFNSLTVKRFQNSFKGEYDARKLKKYIETHF